MDSVNSWVAQPTILQQLWKRHKKYETYLGEGKYDVCLLPSSNCLQPDFVSLFRGVVLGTRKVKLWSSVVYPPGPGSLPGPGTRPLPSASLDKDSSHQQEDDCDSKGCRNKVPGLQICAKRFIQFISYRV